VAVGLVWKAIRGVIDTRLSCGIIARKFHPYRDASGDTTLGHKGYRTLKENATSIFINVIPEIRKGSGNTCLIRTKTLASITLKPRSRLRKRMGVVV